MEATETRTVPAHDADGGSALRGPGHDPSFTARPLTVLPPKGYDLAQGKLVLQSHPVADPAIPFRTRPYETRVYLFEE